MENVVIATVEPRPEHRDEVLEALTRLVVDVHGGDPGCELFALHEDADGRFVIVEKWADEQSLATHSKSEWSIRIHEELEGKLFNEPVSQYLRAVRAGTEELGIM